jgi:hypothetical protein
VALQRASEADRPLRDERTDPFDPVGQPIADCVPAKQRQIQAKAGDWGDLTPKFPYKEMGTAETVSGHTFGVSPFDCAPMQQIVRPQMERAREGTTSCVLYDSAGKEAKHNPGYDIAIIPCEKQFSVSFRCKKLFLKLLFANDR